MTQAPNKPKYPDSNNAPSNGSRSETTQTQDGQVSNSPLTARRVVQDQIEAVQEGINLLGADVVQAAVDQAHQIAQVAIAYPALVAQLVDANLRQAKDAGLLGKPSQTASFSTSLNASDLLRSRLSAHKPRLISGEEMLALPSDRSTSQGSN